MFVYKLYVKRGWKLDVVFECADFSEVEAIVQMFEKNYVATDEDKDAEVCYSVYFEKKKEEA